MDWDLLRRGIFCGECERDEGFREEVLRQSHTGLVLIGWITASTALLLMIGWGVFFVQQTGTHFRFAVYLAIVAIGIAEVRISKIEAAYRHSRWIAICAVELVTLLLLWSALLLGPQQPLADQFIPTQIAMSVLLLVAAQPLIPWMVLVHCTTVGIGYLVLVPLAVSVGATHARYHPEYCLFLALLAMLATSLSALLYRQRWNAYSAYIDALHAASELRQVQSQLARAEAASSMGRLAAAISHEINTPVGALGSAVDTLLLLSSRQLEAGTEQLPRLLRLQVDLRRSIQESSRRLQQIAARIARFTNLDQSDLHPTSLNVLIADVAEFVRPRLKPGSELELDFQPLPELVVNPQQLSAVFYDLLSNSANALNGGGRIRVRTSGNVSGGVEVVVEDNGRGIPKERLANIFDPAFQESTGRVSTGNWSMFNARQIVREHGGEISISSEPGDGTRVTIALPAGHLG